MNPRLMVFAFLIVSFTRLAVAQDQAVEKQSVESIKKPREKQQVIAQDLDGSNYQKSQSQRTSGQVVDQAWVSKQSDALLDIIRILYKGRDADLKNLEAAQAKMTSEAQIERRIALIKATLSQNAAK